MALSRGPDNDEAPSTEQAPVAVVFVYFFTLERSVRVFSYVYAGYVYARRHFCRMPYFPLFSRHFLELPLKAVSSRGPFEKWLQYHESEAFSKNAGKKMPPNDIRVVVTVQFIQSVTWPKCLVE